MRGRGLAGGEAAVAAASVAEEEKEDEEEKEKEEKRGGGILLAGGLCWYEACKHVVSRDGNAARNILRFFRSISVEKVVSTSSGMVDRGR